MEESILYMLLEYFLIFMVGAMIGWVIELVYKRFFKKTKELVNPGFLHGPFLPIYGFTCCFYYAISDVEMLFIFKILLYMLIPTILELFTGAFFLKRFNIRLWDYRNVKFNYKGYICLSFTVAWGILGVIFYFTIFSYFSYLVDFMYAHLETTFILGIIYGFLIIDVVMSFDVVSRVNKVRSELHDEIQGLDNLNIDDLRISIKQKVAESKEKLTIKPTFMRPFKNEEYLREAITDESQKKKKKKKINLHKEK